MKRTRHFPPLRKTSKQKTKGRQEIVAFLKRKWAKELDYKIKKVIRHTATIEFLYDLNMKGMMTQDDDTDPMAPIIGNLTKMV